jgi:hypothetical protein
MTTPDSRAVVAGVMNEHRQVKAWPIPTCSCGFVVGRGEDFTALRNHVTDAIVAALDAAGLLTVGEEHEQWGVRWANGETTEGRRREWAVDEIERHAHNARETRWKFYVRRHPGSLLRRTRTTYPDRVTEWEEADE